jgi:NAD(P)-dependent dehydrogenase (short-subunit alcohol dehydrogenase family)
LLTRNVAAEMGAFAIRVNCIHPGLIETPMIEWVLNHPDPSVQTGVVAQISLGRTGQPCEIGTVAAFFFASEEARYVTGQSQYVDGGRVGK